jgi:hypothetical protein
MVASVPSMASRASAVRPAPRAWPTFEPAPGHGDSPAVIDVQPFAGIGFAAVNMPTSKQLRRKQGRRTDDHLFRFKHIGRAPGNGRHQLLPGKKVDGPLVGAKWLKIASCDSTGHDHLGQRGTEKRDDLFQWPSLTIRSLHPLAAWIGSPT